MTQWSTINSHWNNDQFKYNIFGRLIHKSVSYFIIITLCFVFSLTLISTFISNKWCFRVYQYIRLPLNGFCLNIVKQQYQITFTVYMTYGTTTRDVFASDYLLFVRVSVANAANAMGWTINLIVIVPEKKMKKSSVFYPKTQINFPLIPLPKSVHQVFKSSAFLLRIGCETHRETTYVGNNNMWRRKSTKKQIEVRV